MIGSYTMKLNNGFNDLLIAQFSSGNESSSSTGISEVVHSILVLSQGATKPKLLVLAYIMFSLNVNGSVGEVLADSGL